MKAQQLYILVKKHNDHAEEIIESIQEESQDLMMNQVHALTGNIIHHTIRIRGMTKKKAITNLIDSGSTHNFLDSKVAKQVGCLILHTSPLMVTVANGNRLASTGRCSNFQWPMHGHKFKNEVRILALLGCDAALGVE